MAKKKAAKKKVKKLKSKKLEDRIAPGMVGGGIIDPGMAEGGDQQQDHNHDSSAGQVEDTVIEGSDYSGEAPAGETGHYDQGPAPDSAAAQHDASAHDSGPAPDSAAADQGDYNELNQADQAGGDYVDEGGQWTEPDWVTENADGGVHIEPPEGVTLDDGTASFPVDVANEELPLPEGTEIQGDGSLNVSTPDGTEYLEDSGTLVLPAGETDMSGALDDNFESWTNPDGSVSVDLPQDQVNFDSESGTLNFSNDVVNDMAPEFMEVGTDGSVDISFPDGTEFNDDGSIDIPADATFEMDNPPPEYVEEVDFAEYNPDGSITFECPDGCTIDDGYANFDHDAAEEHLPIPEEFDLHEDGTADVTLPEGTTYDADANSLTFPSGEVPMDEIPDGIDAHQNPDGSVTAAIPDGMEYNADAGTIHMDNYWVNEFSPDSVAVGTDGSVAVEIPPDSTVEGNTVTVTAEHNDFVNAENPDYVHDAEFIDANGDGSYHVNLPDGVEVDQAAGTAEIPHDMVDDIPMPEEITINSDGTMDIEVPDGTQYDADAGTLAFPQGTVHIDELPTDMNAHIGPDGSTVVYLEDGMEFDSNSNSVSLNNDWANEIAPGPVEIQDDGSLVVQLPEDTQYNDDGSLDISPGHADFLEDPAPEYVDYGPDWVDANPDGSVTFEPPQEVQIDSQAGEMTMPLDYANEQFDNYIPEDVTLNADGTMDIKLPEDISYDADSGVLTFGEGDAPNTDEFPPQVDYQWNDDGSLAVTLPDGVEYDAGAGTVHMDEYWTGEFMPDSVELTDNGELKVDLPNETHFHSDGSFTVPEHSADFVENPDPQWSEQGPDWVEPAADGSINIQPPDEYNVNAEEGTLTAPIDTVGEHFDEYIPEDVTFNADGTMDVKLDEGVSFDSDAGTLTFPEGADGPAPGELQEWGIDYSMEGENIVVTLPDGIDYNADTGSVHMDNYWTNEITPEPVEFHEDGNYEVNLPPDTQYNGDGSFNVPEYQSDFMDNPAPDYANGGPDFVDINEDGSVHVEPPADITIDPEAGTASMSVDSFNEHFDEQIPDEFTFNADGSLDIQLPEGTTYDADANSLTFAPGEVHLDEMPEGVDAQLNEQGGVVVVLPDGVDYSDGSVHMNSDWASNMTPDAISLSDSGVQIELPPDTQYHEDGTFTISPENADFLEEPHYEHEGHETPAQSAAS